jgi:hypothetical protein
MESKITKPKAKLFLCLSLFLLFIGLNGIAQESKTDFSNPALIGGSSILHVFQQLFNRQEFDTMLKFTATVSKKRFGSQAILDYYQTMSFSFPIKLKSIKKSSEGYTMRYSALINATTNTLLLRILIENDSCKIIIPDLTSKYFLVQ